MNNLNNTEKTIELYDEVETVIRKTNNYSKFKNILGNRDLRGTNYNKLIKSMKEKQLIIPILCNDKMEIIDGQHRYEACKELHYPLYYYVVDGYEIDDVKRANLVSCNWVIDDYLNLNVEIGKEDYKKFKEIKEEYKLSSAQLLEVFAKFQEKSLNEVKMLFEDGTFEINKLEEVMDFLIALKDFSVLKEHTSMGFTKAFLKLYSLEDYNHKTMVSRVEKQSYKLEKRGSYRQYLELLVEIYNFGALKKRFGYDSKNDRFYDI